MQLDKGILECETAQALPVEVLFYHQAREPHGYET